MQSRANLFPGGRDRMNHSGPYADLSGSNIRARRLADGTYELETSTLSRSDARVLGKGQLNPVAKKTNPKAPDFVGYLDEPDDEHGVAPRRFRAAAWARPIAQGNRAGQTYLSLSLEAPLAA